MIGQHDARLAGFAFRAYFFSQPLVLASEGRAIA